MRVSAKFDVWDIEPSADPAWTFAPDKLRRDFWREVVRLVKASNEFERARGRDRHGRKLKGITRFTMLHRRSAMGPADPFAPPLTPGDERSRTVAYFDGRAYPDHAEFFWRNGWGKILSYHRRGAWNIWARRRLPIRDVIGISPAALRKVEKQAAAWWVTRRDGVFELVPEPKPKPKPKPEPEPKPAERPKRPAKPKIKPVPKPIAATGRMDFENFTFGIGMGSGVDMARTAFQASYFTGFRRISGGMRSYGKPKQKGQ